MWRISSVAIRIVVKQWGSERQPSGAGTMRIMSISTSTSYMSHKIFTALRKVVVKIKSLHDSYYIARRHVTATFDDHGLFVKALASGMRQCGVAAR